MNGDISRGCIGDHFRNDERTDLPWSAVDETGVLLLEFLQAADAATEDGAAPVGVFAGKIGATVPDGDYGRVERELGKAVEMPHQFGIQTGVGLEVLDLSGKPGLECTGINLFDQRDTI